MTKVRTTAMFWVTLVYITVTLAPVHPIVELRHDVEVLSSRAELTSPFISSHVSLTTWQSVSAHTMILVNIIWISMLIRGMEGC
jgi:hypothetical protein